MRRWQDCSMRHRPARWYMSPLARCYQPLVQNSRRCSRRTRMSTSGCSISSSTGIVGHSPNQARNNKEGITDTQEVLKAHIRNPISGTGRGREAFTEEVGNHINQGVAPQTPAMALVMFGVAIGIARLLKHR